MQKGFSSLIVVVIVALLAVGAGGWWYTQQGATGSEETSEESATSSAVAKGESKTKGGAKTKVKACDVLTISKVSSITGVSMIYTPDLTEDTMSYEDGDVWNSICAFYEPGNSQESAGVTLMITEGLSAEAKAFVREEFDNLKAEAGTVAISGFGDKAFKVSVGDGVIGTNQYYVLVGDMMLLAYSGIGHGQFAGERPEYTYTEQTDQVTEEVLKHVLSQVR